MDKKYTYIDLFAGCGGLSLGLHNAGWKGLFAIEKSPDAFKTLKFNLIDKKKHFDWPKWLPQENLDINNILEKYETNLKKLRGKVDLVSGGPPCQGFSTAGKRKENDVRNGMIRSYLRFIMHVRPKVIFFENVKGFTLKFEKNKSKGKTYSEYVLRVLKFFGYEVHGKMLDFSNYGLPQKRTRFILIGIRKDIAVQRKVNVIDFFINLITNSKTFLKEQNLPENPNLGDAISDLLNSNGTTECLERKGFLSGIYSEPKSLYQKHLRKGQPQIPNSHSFPRHKRETIEKFAYFIKNEKANKNICELTRTKFNISKHTIIRLDINSQAPTITTLPDDYVHYSEPRILTVREYARIQTFPDWFEFKGKYTTGGPNRVKEVPRYTQIGNAIPPLFGEQCGLILKNIIN